jgi:predicted cobalt transporter CbtA
MINIIDFPALAVLIVLVYMLLNRKKLWISAIVFGALSAALIVLIYITPSPEPGFAGAAFGYNFSFFFPVVLSSLVFWIAALGFYIGFVRSRAGRSPSKIILPLTLLFPFTVQAAWIIIGLLMLRQPL